MSTSELYHAFGIRGYQYVKSEFEGGESFYTVRQGAGSLRCSACGSSRVVRRGYRRRRFRCPPIGLRPVQIVLDVARVECQDCGVLRQVRVGFSDGQRSYTRGFERHVLGLSRHMTILDVARHLQVSWDVVKDIQKRMLTRRRRGSSASNSSIFVGWRSTRYPSARVIGT